MPAHLGFRPILLVALAATAVLAGAGCTTEHQTAAAARTDARQCFRARDVDSFSVVDDSTVNIRVGVNDYYRLDLFAPCNGAVFVEGMALRTRGGADFVCSPADAELTIPSPSGPMRCIVNGIHKLTPEEVAALNPKFKP